MSLADYAYRFGPRVTEAGTTFRLWAPTASGVQLEPGGHDPIPMQAVGDGWWELETGLAAGTRYRFGVGGHSVPDPASRLQDKDVHDASVVLAGDGYAWRHAEWRGRPWHETVLYELHPGVLGGYDGIASRLPELASLGVTAIELMPIADFPGPRNWGYDGVLPYAPDTAYGTPEQLKALIDTAHGLGLMVFLDVVYNHFGPDGNYLGTYADTFFRDDLDTPWGPAIDFRQPEVRSFFAENALYWLREYRFDGLRLDAVHAISERGWLQEMAAFVRARLPADRYVHLVLENDDNMAHLLESGFDAQWNDDAHHVLHVLLTGEDDGYYEDYAGGPEARLARCLKEGFIYQGEASEHRGGKPRGEPSAHLPPTAFVMFLQNHDQIGNRAFGERLAALLDAQPPRDEPNPLAAAVALMLLCPHIPLLFMGEEIGAKDPFLYFTSHNDTLAQAVRDGRRQEFSRFAAFAGGAALTDLPDPNARHTYAKSSPFASPHVNVDESIWSAYYWRLLKTRRQRIVPYLPQTRALDAAPVGARSVHAAWRLGNGDTLALWVNLGESDAALEAPPGAGEILFESRPGYAQQAHAGVLGAGGLLATLQPQQAGAPQDDAP
ncbi:malto-oligosyltrehalose trehalohydrolase [Verticiella sediminum]|uniref:Malto-oligosyltrehalose trehalohydrolase n=1 Tax=Verticiella sediminum TaxID=1247510 RepID=A0A556ATS7_9BURK|nr:malto-oligosyltrehalose trehalohydrolase [Verticiella sediminum]TSH95795.1 malto-oligosyltrehalose trehalohydrolase [Verticiella sediminum]